MRPGPSSAPPRTSGSPSWAIPCSAWPSRRPSIRAQAVSGRSCRAVAERLGLPERLRAAAPADVGPAALEALVSTERVLASVIEAVIGACYLHFGYERTAEAVHEAFGPEIEQALERPAD